MTNFFQDWDVASNVKAICFDATSRSTGTKSGACTLIEKSFDKDWLYFPFRLYILELVLHKGFLPCFGPSSGPDILLIKRFPGKWNALKKNKYVVLNADDCDSLLDIVLSREAKNCSSTR